MAPRSVAVLVLGDVGRSPRMQYHTTSLAALPDTDVSLVGYAGERCIDAVEKNPRVHQYLLGSPFAKLPRSLFLLWAPLKVLYQIFQLFWTLLVAIPRPDAILVQNPPSIPALLAVWVAARVRGARMVVDWHNFGYTVLAHSLGRDPETTGHPLVAAARAYERLFGRLGDGHICVTDAMRVWLREHWGINATVLYDRPPPFFRAATPDETHDLFLRLGEQLPEAIGSGGAPTPADSGSSSSSSAPATAKRRAASPGRHGGKGAAAGGTSSSTTNETAVCRTLVTEEVRLPPAPARGAPPATTVVCKRRDRPAVLVSSTSWTPDEDFGILLDALVALDAAAAAEPGAFPDFLVVVTGKGPMRAAYEAKIARLALRRVAVRTLWLAAGDYPVLLGSADAGVCLHTSTSGLDLPMKVVDMFGAGLPVAAVGFPALPELVVHGTNGLVFDTAAGLARHLQALFRGFPDREPSAGALVGLRAGVARFQAVRWQDNWDANVRRLFVPPGGGESDGGVTEPPPPDRRR